MPTHHVVVGAGPVGAEVARLLAATGVPVRLVTRTGAGPDHPLVERLAVDATDTDRLTELAGGAAVLYNCANPAYHRWAQLWPPLATAILTAAERSGAVLATVSNLYGYGPVDGPMHEDLPLRPTATNGRVRADLWEQALAAHRAGRARVTEVRGSDYLGPGATSAPMRVVPALLGGKPARVLGDPDAAHSFTAPRDVARLLVTVAADERAWGRPWHVPSNPPVSMRTLVEDLCRTAGIAPVAVSAMPPLLLRALALVSPTMRALHEVSYQHDRPFVVDDSRARATFGLEPIGYEDLLRACVAVARQRA